MEITLRWILYSNLTPYLRYKYSEIKKITKSFSDELGRGGYGSVYKGVLPDGSLVVVKILIEAGSNGEEFINEVASISRTSHVNIVNLLGFCYDRNKRALVYEFMSNKSLDKFINKNNCLDLDKLYKIAVGVAKGLQYLHTGCSTRIVHFDIKPQNILLDEEFSPKISDFGLAKLCKKKQSILSVVGARGTIGYIAPEIFSRNFGGAHKSDVYSYGMMILEMVGAIKFDEIVSNQSSENYFPDKMYEQVILDVTTKLDDLVIEDDDEVARKMFLIGFWCIQTSPSDRPPISKVVEMLEGSLRSIQIPPKPLLFSPSISGNGLSSSLPQYYQTCGKTFSCGENITGIGYPFLEFSDPPYCGHPSFVLTCNRRKNITNIEITGMKYRVLEIAQTNQTMTIAREDIMEEPCPTEMKNTTLDYTIFKYAAFYTNITFMYGCFPASPSSYPVLCQNNSTAHVFRGGHAPAFFCLAGVIVPYPGSGYAGQSGLSEHLQQGFKIRWKINGTQTCSNCTAIEGRCVVLGVAAFVVLVIIIVVWYLKRRRSRTRSDQLSNKDIENLLLQHGSLVLKRYKYSEIKKMTKSFNDKLGRGGFGSVYKGALPDGSLVAVKVLTETDSNGEEFINEVASISRTSHVNIVNLLGFCFARNKRALVYEFMPNKSLDKFIGNKDCPLDMASLYKIAIGVAKGLEYLHTGCNTRIVHFDIKPQNILLDEDLCPKISDFGLAKLCKKKQSIISMIGARGTIGYIAPEIFSRNFGGASHKSDVYSYGMMILEMAGAGKFDEVETTGQSSLNYFPDKIYEQVVLGVTMKLNDNLVIDDKEEIARKMFLTGFWCIQTIPSDRPPMSKVVEMLEGSIQSIRTPPKPFIFSPTLSGNGFSPSLSTYVELEHSVDSPI
ncbi:hypothetical protein ACP275_12G031200 [Erythranthe tilingii]